jgi:hypothetical protein
MLFKDPIKSPVSKPLTMKMLGCGTARILGPWHEMEVLDQPNALDDFTSKRRNTNMYCTTAREPQIWWENSKNPSPAFEQSSRRLNQSILWHYPSSCSCAKLVTDILLNFNLSVSQSVSQSHMKRISKPQLQHGTAAHSNST